MYLRTLLSSLYFFFVVILYFVNIFVFAVEFNHSDEIKIHILQSSICFLIITFSFLEINFIMKRHFSDCNSIEQAETTFLQVVN